MAMAIALAALDEVGFTLRFIARLERARRDGHDTAHPTPLPARRKADILRDG